MRRLTYRAEQSTSVAFLLIYSYLGTSKLHTNGGRKLELRLNEAVAWLVLADFGWFRCRHFCPFPAFCVQSDSFLCHRTRALLCMIGTQLVFDFKICATTVFKRFLLENEEKGKERRKKIYISLSSEAILRIWSSGEMLQPASGDFRGWKWGS